MLSLLGNIAIVMSMLQDPKVKKLFENTNTRIYQAFQGIDALLKKKAGCGQPITSAVGGQPMSATWAPAYLSWIDSKIVSQNALIISTASALSSSLSMLQIQANNNAARMPLSTAFHSFTKAYDINSMTFDYNLAGMVGVPLIIQRTEEACTLTSTPVTLTSNSVASMVTTPPSIVSVNLLPAMVTNTLPSAPSSPPTVIIGEPTVAIVVYNYADCTTTPCIDTSHVYETLGAGLADPCGGPGVYTQPSNFGPGPLSSVHLGPFTAHGAVGCIFDGTTAGANLTCQGLAPITCTVPNMPMTLQCGKSSASSLPNLAWELGHCEW